MIRIIFLNITIELCIIDKIDAIKMNLRLAHMKVARSFFLRLSLSTHAKLLYSSICSRRRYGSASDANSATGAVLLP